MPVVRALSVACIATALILSGCSGTGGGGGGGGAESASTAPTPAPTPNPAPAPSVTLVGSRAMPSGTITISVEGAVTAGAPATILVDLPADYPAIASIEACIAHGGTAATTLASTTIQRSPGRYAVTVTAPPAIPADARVFVRLTHADGAVEESGIEDFPLR